MHVFGRVRVADYSKGLDLTGIDSAAYTHKTRLHFPSIKLHFIRGTSRCHNRIFRCLCPERNQSLRMVLNPIWFLLLRSSSLTRPSSASTSTSASSSVSYRPPDCTRRTLLPQTFLQWPARSV